MAVPVDAMPMASLVDLVNGWGSAPRIEAGERDECYPRLDGLDGRLGVPDGAGPLTDETLTRVADQIHPVFATGEPAVRARLVNQLLAATGVRPVLSGHADRLRGSWLVDDACHVVLAAAVVAVRTYLGEHPSDRLGMCAGRRCADVYVDASPGGQRRFCSVTCQNRTRIAAFRSRRAAAT